jgi:CBS domain-containing protein
MKTIAEVMSLDVTSVAPDDSIRHAAELMEDLDIGALPVTDGQRLVGMITDRDITIRATALGLGPDDTDVSDVMTTEVACCHDDQSVEEVVQDMRDLQVRRIPVVSRDNGTLVGIVALADLVDPDMDAGIDAQATAETLRDISSPMGSQPSP